MSQDTGVRANQIGLAANILLTLLKFTIGTLAGSAALVADGFNSAGDIFATIVAYLGYNYARKPPDEDHHYGHGNAESVAGLIVGVLLMATGLFISLEGLMVLLGEHREPPDVPALYVAGFTILVKELLFRYVSKVGKKLNSPSLLASARDHRADVFVGITVFAGIFASRFNMPFLDPLAAVVIGLYIAWMAVDPVRTNVGILMDKAPPHLKEEIRKVVKGNPDVREVDQIRVHPLGSYYVVDFEVYLDGSLSLHAAHDIAHELEDRIQSQFEFIRDVHVHVNPTGPRPKKNYLELN
ncbi:MAG TPA: cation transporter [Planctomycetes bacterium]|nr:cation transporter [Planctomycetota bacterium]